MSGKTKVFHRWMALFLCVVMFVSLLPAGSAFAQGGQTIVLGLEDDLDDLDEFDSSEDDWMDLGLEEEPAEEPSEPEDLDEETEEEDLWGLDDLDDVSEEEAFASVTIPTDVEFSVVKDNNAMKIVWEPMVMDEGGEVPQYRIYRLQRNTPDLQADPFEEEAKWGLYRLADVSTNIYAEELSFRDTSISNGFEYLYLVQCLDAEGTPISDGFGYDNDDPPSFFTVSIADLKDKVSFTGSWVPYTYYSFTKPIMSEPVITTEGIQLSWTGNWLSGASFVVLRWDNYAGDWAEIATTPWSTYTDTSVVSGETYIYGVRVLGTDGYTYMSDMCDRTLTKDPTDPSGKAYLDTSIVDATFMASTSVLSLKNCFDTAAVPKKNYIRITWTPVDGADDYTIERRERIYNYVGSWQTLENAKGGIIASGAVGPSGNPLFDIDPDGNYHFDDYQVLSRNVYDYRVRPMVNNPDYNPSIPGSPKYLVVGIEDDNFKSIDYYDTPVLKDEDVEVSDEGVTIWWQAVDGVSVYQVLRRVATSKTDDPEIYTWKVIDTVVTSVESGKLSYTDLTAAAGIKNLNGQIYFYSVVARNDANTVNISPYDPEGVAANYTRMPTLIGTTVAPTGIAVLWNLVDGAEDYRIFRRVAGTTKWSVLADVNDPTGYDMSGLEEYYMYNPPTPGTTGGYIDTTAKQGITYEYTVRAFDMADSKYISSYDKNGVRGLWFEAPVMNASLTKSVSGGIQVAWDAVEGARYYRIFRRVNGLSEPWVEIADVEDNGECLYVDSSEKLNEGATYDYTVCVLSADGAKASVVATEISVTYYPMPTLLNIESKKESLLITWRKVASCDNYLVYRKTINSDWEIINYISGDYSVASYVYPTANIIQYANPEETIVQYMDEDVISGTKYWYTVACWDGSTMDMSGMNPEPLSGMDPIGLTKSFYGDQHAVINGKITLQRVTNGAKITWTTVDNVASYEILRREKNSDWKAVGVVAADTADRYGLLNFTDTTARNLGTYWYMIACLDGYGQELGYLEASEITFYATPVMKTIKMTEKLSKSDLPGFIEIAWGDVDGATTYNIYRKKANAKNWELYYSDYDGTVPTVGTTFQDDGSYTAGTPATLVSNTLYTYTVAVSDGSGNDLSDKDPNGLSITFLAAPDLISAVPGDKGNTVQWRSVKGAQGYKVYRRAVDDPNTPSTWSSWKEIATVVGYAKQTYLDSSATASGYYQYTVRAYRGNILSGYIDDASEVLTAIYVPAPVIAKIINRENPQGSGNYYQTVTWKEINGATYELEYKNDTLRQKWGDNPVITVPAGAGTGTVSYDNTVEYLSNKPYKYSYRVRAVSGATGTDKSNYSAVLSLTYYPPVNVGTTWAVNNTGNAISWTPIRNINTYRIYRWLNEDGAWKAIATVGGNSYIDRTVTSTEAWYKVVGIVAGLEVTSLEDCNPSQAQFFHLNAPVLVSIKMHEDPTKNINTFNKQIAFTFTGVEGATQYKIGRKIGSATTWTWTTVSVSSLIDVNGDGSQYTYLYTGSGNNQKFTFTAAAKVSSPVASESDYNQYGLSLTYFKQVTGLSATAWNDTNGVKHVKLTWSAVPYAGLYGIYVQDPYVNNPNKGDGWILLANTGTTSYEFVPADQTSTFYSISNQLNFRVAVNAWGNRVGPYSNSVKK